MKKCRKLLSMMLIATIMVTLMQTNLSSAKAKVKINKSKITLTVGKKAQLKVTGTKQKVTWSSSNENVAVVSSKGKVVALKKGTAKITAKVQKKKYYCKVTVVQKETTKPTITPTDEPTAEPTIVPTKEPTAEPTIAPTKEPAVEPTIAPTDEPTAEPTIAPTVKPTATPTVAPSNTPLDTYVTLAAYIKNNGEYDVNSDGVTNYSIYETERGNNASYLNQLAYYPNDDYLEFTTYMGTTSGDTLLKLEINRASIATGDMTFIVTTDNNKTVVDYGEASVYVNKISKNSTINFGCIYKSGNELANSLLQYGLICWDSMIKDYGIKNGLQALGFTSYK
mgnify:FL=1